MQEADQQFPPNLSSEELGVMIDLDKSATCDIFLDSLFLKFGMQAYPSTLHVQT